MKVSSRRVRIDLTYDGTDFAGWQVQPAERTVQGELEGVLTRLQGGQAVRVRGAGRTDRGVHARLQVADCEIATPLDDPGLCHALRGMLPEDLRPISVKTVEPAFHSRRQAIRRTYRYRLDLTEHGDPFVRRFALHRRRPLDGARLTVALRRLPGRRDWTGFAGAAGNVSHPVRRLSEALYRESGPEVAWFSFTADGFLNFMVRNLVGTLLAIADGRMPVERIDEILQRRDRRLAGPTAPAKGLVLWDVVYPARRTD